MPTWNFKDAIVAADRRLKGLGSFVVVDEGTVRFDLDGGGSFCFDLLPYEKLTPTSLLRALASARGVPTPLLATPYVDKKMACELRDAAVPFIDSAGNVFLRGETLLVWQVGAQPAANRKPEGDALATRAFQPTGLRFLYEIMIRDCSLVARTYRELSDLTGASLGAIGGILRSLKKNGFLAEIDGERRLINRAELLDQWCTAYRQKLRPKNFVGRFSFRRGQDLVNAPLPPGVLLGGEPAAAQLTDALHPEVTTLYTQSGVNLCIARLGLRENTTGDVELLTGFWHTPAPETDRVPPLLIYADLITSGSSRNAEAARVIYGRFLGETFV